MSFFRRRSSAQSVPTDTLISPVSRTPISPPTTQWNDVPHSWTSGMTVEGSTYDVTKQYATANNNYKHRRSLITNLITKAHDPHKSEYRDWRDTISPSAKKPRPWRRWGIMFCVILVVISGTWIVLTNHTSRQLWSISSLIRRWTPTMNTLEVRGNMNHLDWGRFFAKNRDMPRDGDEWYAAREDIFHGQGGKSTQLVQERMLDALEQPVQVHSEETRIIEQTQPRSRVEEMWAKHARVIISLDEEASQFANATP